MRKDGNVVKDAMASYYVLINLMKDRTDSMNMMTMDIPLEPMKKYIREKRADGKRLGHLAIVMTAYLRTITEYPELNRFVVNKKLYQRNEITSSMVVLKEGDIEDETFSKVYYSPQDSVFDVQRKMDEYISEGRKAGESTATDKLANTLVHVPGLLGIGCGIFKFLEKRGLLPQSIIDASPFHTSLCITNLTSIRTNHIYHHCYDFGTVSEFISLGNFREVPKRVGGQVVFETCLPIGLVMDERICSGSYCAKAFQKFKNYCAHPELLEQPPKVDNITPTLKEGRK